MKELFFTCDVVPDSQLEVMLDNDGAAFLINNGATGEGGCVGEVCLNREQTIRLCDWLREELREEIKTMKIGVPVKCQNGHRAVWFYRFRGLDVISEGVPEKGKCDCPKEDWGEGYFADGEPFVVVGNPPQWE